MGKHVEAQVYSYLLRLRTCCEQHQGDLHISSWGMRAQHAQEKRYNAITHGKLFHARECTHIGTQLRCTHGIDW